MVDLDIESPLTKIPAEETIANIINDLFLTNDKAYGKSQL